MITCIVMTFDQRDIRILNALAAGLLQALKGNTSAMT